jgi:hypothetical protein
MERLFLAISDFPIRRMTRIYGPSIIAYGYVIAMALNPLLATVMAPLAEALHV